MIIRSIDLRVTRYGGSTPLSKGGGQLFITATSSPFDDERGDNGRHSNDS